LNLADCLTQIPAFAALDDATRQALQAEFQPVTLPAGAALFQQGDPGDALYIVTSGKLSVVVRQPDGEETCLEEIGACQWVGEVALLTGQPRGASVVASEETQLARLTRVDFERLSQAHPEILAEFACRVQPRIQRAQLSGILTALFGHLDAATLQSLQERLEWRCLTSGEVLFRQGEPGETMYIIVQGRLRLSCTNPDGSERILGEAGSGESIGEFALLAESGTPDSLRSATVSAIRTTYIVGLTRAVFESLLYQYPQMMLYITRRIVQRQRRITLPTSSGEASLGLVLLPVSSGVPLEDFAKPLAEALGKLGPALYLDNMRFDAQFGMPGVSSTPLEHATSLMINAWLTERESEYRFMIYAVEQPLKDGALSPWAERCIQAADVLLLVGRAGDDPTPGAVEAALTAAHPRARVELALIHPDHLDHPAGTLSWLAPRKTGPLAPGVHHHVRLGQQDDFRCLARRLAGKALGVVFSGGGARGLSHIGAIRALEEAGIQPDLIAGASMGALIGAGYALGWGPDKLTSLANEFSSPGKLLDYTFPVVSLTATRKITALLQSLVGQLGIEDTWRTYFCVSTNLTRGLEEVHGEGPLWSALRASMAFPAVFSPMLNDQGDLLIDGGGVNNLPIDLMRQAVGSSGMVIGINISSPDSSRKFDFGPSVSGWNVLWRRLNPLAKPAAVPTILDVVAGIVDTNSRHHLARVQQQCDLLIEPPVGQFGLLEFGSYEKIIEIGYQYTRQVLSQYSGQHQLV
jgi:lysophospholipid hydrolase